MAKQQAAKGAQGAKVTANSLDWVYGYFFKISVWTVVLAGAIRFLG